MAEQGDSALQLSLYHPDLNPTEMIWVTLKDETKQVTFSSVTHHGQLAALSGADWKSRYEHVKRTENYMALDQDYVMDCFAINTDQDNSNEDYFVTT